MEIRVREEYAADPRTACKYGINCYQRHPSHLSKFKHPPKKPGRTTDAVCEPPLKKKKNDKEIKCNSVDKEFNNGYQNTDTNNDVQISSSANILIDIDEKKFIKNKFLVDMPQDFYDFWYFCKKLNKDNPLMALKDVGLILVGPFDVLGGKFTNTPEKTIEEYVLHWRYFYDPPEFQTVIRQNNDSGYHIGYFRDSPDEMPVFLACNFSKIDGTFTVIGDNLFAAVSSFLDFLKKTADPFMKANVSRYSTLIQKEAENLKLSLSKSTTKLTSRNRKILAKTFNKLGFVVPYNKHTQVGYRPLTISNKGLQALLEKLDKAAPSEKDKRMIELQEVLTNTNIAIDECDFGTGIELGLDILCSGVETLSSVCGRLLATCYRLVNREAFAVTVESHMKNRRRDLDLSII